MALPRFMSLVDFAVLAVIAVAVFLPPREMYAENAIKGDEFGVALAEARTMASPNDGRAIEAFTRKLSEAGLKDWAIEAAVRMSDHAKDSPAAPARAGAAPGTHRKPPGLRVPALEAPVLHSFFLATRGAPWGD